MLLDEVYQTLKREAKESIKNGSRLAVKLIEKNDEKGMRILNDILPTQIKAVKEPQNLTEFEIEKNRALLKLHTQTPAWKKFLFSAWAVLNITCIISGIATLQPWAVVSGGAGLLMQATMAFTFYSATNANRKLQKNLERMQANVNQARKGKEQKHSAQE